MLTLLVITIALTGIFLMRLLNVSMTLSDDNKTTRIAFTDPRVIQLSREWITQDERLVLEALDSRLVGVIDAIVLKKNELVDEHAVQKLVQRIERRLYVFPFLCIHQHDLHIQVSGIVGRTIENMRKLQDVQSEETLHKFKMDKWGFVQDQRTHYIINRKQ